MKFNSPLRYPGGKNKLAKFVALICEKNNINGHYVEPYAGGASVALFLLLNKYVKKITINDKDKAIYAFWYAVLNNTDKFCRLINETEVTIKNWKKFREIQKNKDEAKLFDLGFSTFFLNRTNISGILDAGPIGGISQKGNYKINCRFNKKELTRKIKEIAKFKTRIKLYNLDALDLIAKIDKESNKSSTVFYFDPPYYVKGESLYLNYYEPKDHKEVSERIKKIRKARWIVSYDNNKEIKKLYKSFSSKEYNLIHSAHTYKLGKEILFFSKNLTVPRVVEPVNI